MFIDIAGPFFYTKYIKSDNTVKQLRHAQTYAKKCVASLLA